MAVTLTEYYQILDGLDWSYEMSDDQGVWRRGNQEMSRAIGYYSTSPAHKKLYDDFKAHKWSSWKTKEDGTTDYTQRVIPKPEKPND